MARRKSGGFAEGHDEGIGKGEFANMPQDVHMSAYPKGRSERDEGIDDSMSDIDGIEGASEGKRRRYLSNQK